MELFDLLSLIKYNSHMANVAHKPRSADDYLKWIIGGSVALVVVILGLFIWSDSKNALQPKAVIGKSPAKTVS